MLSIEELLELEDAIRENLIERLEEILTKMNRTGQLEEFVRLIGMGELLGEVGAATEKRKGKIIVIGQSEVPKEKLASVANNLGIDKERFEFYLNFNDAKYFNFRKTQWSDSYSAILVGEMPHSGKAKGEYSSIISAIESQEGYPPVVRVGTKGLKITKASFKYTLEYLIKEQKIA